MYPFAQMDLLTIAGIGPENWSERRKTLTLVMLGIGNGEGGVNLWAGRHTPEEYVEFHQMLERAAAEHKALEEHLPQLLESTLLTQTFVAESNLSRPRTFTVANDHTVV